VFEGARPAGNTFVASAYAHTTTAASVSPPRIAAQRSGARRTSATPAANTPLYASRRPESCQLWSGCTDHTIETALSAVNASSRPTGHTPYARFPGATRITLAATSAPAPSVSAISVVVIDSRFSPPLA